MADRSRLADLERRVDADPASIAFAQLAEEYRRQGRLDDAIRVCRAGLAHHPAHLSARVTLARALSGLGQTDAAQNEMRELVRESPDHVGVRRMLAELERVPAPAGQDAPLDHLESWLEAVIADRKQRHATP